MGAANSRSGSARVSVLAIADSAARFVGQALRPPPAGFQFKISARQAMRLSYNGFEL
jgi:hypothetical protein